MNHDSVSYLPELPQLHLLRQLREASYNPSAPLWLRALCENAAGELGAALQELAHHEPMLATTKPLHRLIDEQIDRERQRKERVINCECRQYPQPVPMNMAELSASVLELQASPFAATRPAEVALIMDACSRAMDMDISAARWAALADVLGSDPADVDAVFAAARRLTSLAGRDHALLQDCEAFTRYAASCLIGDHPLTQDWKDGFEALGEPLQAKLATRLAETYPRPAAPELDPAVVDAAFDEMGPKP